MRRLAFAALCLASAALAFAQSARAADLATGAAIQAAISGNTVQGSMLDSGAYSEFYAADGTIKGADYTGAWSIQGDTMCFAYGADPASCFGVRIEGDAITWVQDGADKGTGTLVTGNPNGF